MLVDPPLRYHLPQAGWVRYDRAIDDIPEVRHEYVDWLQYAIKLIDPHYSVLDADVIDIYAGSLTLIVDGGGMRSPPPRPDHEDDMLLYREISLHVSKSRKMALELLYSELISEGRFRVYARKHEPDADLQLVPGSVWEATHAGREPRASTAHLTTGKAYYDVHFERVEPAVRCGGEGSSDPVSIKSQPDPNTKIDRLMRETARMKQHIENALPNRLTREMLREQLGYSPRSEKFEAHYRVAKEQLQLENPKFAEIYKLGRPPRERTERR